MRRLACAMLLCGSAACAPGPAGSATAIYVPPTRLGGQGSVMFLPAPAAQAAVARDELLFRTVLSRMGKDGACVTPALGYPPFTSLRRDMVEAGRAATATPALRSTVVRAVGGGWQAPDGKIDPALEARLIEASIAIVEREWRLPLPDLDKRRIGGPKLPAGWLAEGQSLRDGGNCSQITLSEASRHGALAFIDVGIVHGPLNGVGERWAMEWSSGSWSLVARKMLWVS